MKANYFEIDDNKILDAKLTSSMETVSHCVFESINLSSNTLVNKLKFHDCIFLGCVIPDAVMNNMDASCLVFPNIRKPFKTFPNRLYDSKTLYAGYDYCNEQTFENCYDTKVYRHYMSFGKRGEDYVETLARSLHDHSITNALQDLLDASDEKKVVGVMGGHAKRRDDPDYLKIVLLSKHLTEKGRLMVTGGGPGAMEATHLGAWMAGRSDADAVEAVAMLSPSPTFTDKGWLSLSFQVMDRFPLQSDYRSLAIPTWYYGHEPTAPFATDIAKYFDNSVREDGIVTIAKGGIIYTPGSAGTLQEIFEDAAQNHYESVGYASPMVFMGEDYWTNQMPIYPLLHDLQEKGRYKNLLLTISDDESKIIEAIMNFA